MRNSTSSLAADESPRFSRSVARAELSERMRGWDRGSKRRLEGRTRQGLERETVEPERGALTMETGKVDRMIDLRREKGKGNLELSLALFASPVAGSVGLASPGAWLGLEPS